MTLLAERFSDNCAAVLREYPYRGKTIFWDLLQRKMKRREDQIFNFPGDYKMLLDTRDYWQRIMAASCYERREYWMIRQLVRPGDIFFDIGANIGYYTLLAASLVGPEGKVYAFEPHPDSREILSRQTQMNPSLPITILSEAVSDQAGTADFYLPPDDDYFYQRGSASLDSQPDWKSCKVSCLTLDQFIKERNIKKVPLVKMDVERAEGKVLKGARSALSSGLMESLILEITDASKEEAAEEILKYSFDFFYDLRFMKIHKRFKNTLPSGTCPINVFCARGEAAARWNQIGIRRYFV